jgi:hypothetical protein
VTAQIAAVEVEPWNEPELRGELKRVEAATPLRDSDGSSARDPLGRGRIGHAAEPEPAGDSLALRST